ncbi:MAG: chorismate synthase [Nitrospinae bacterium]|nr:chorismate synthase [Nitrospinota bacterium]
MSGNSFGTIFRITTFGESHGVGLGVVIDGCPAGIKIDEAFIQSELDRRRVGQSKVTSRRDEPDKVEILSGVFEGVATGAPICLIIRNKDADSSKYNNLKEVFRPGHADMTYQKKYGIRDHRGGGRSSGRETAARVAAGAIAKMVLGNEISIHAWTDSIKDIHCSTIDLEEVEKNIVRAADPIAAKKMEECILAARKNNNSVGGVVKIRVKNAPIGLGEPVFDKLDADLAKALMSIGSVKGVEIGGGFALTKMFGSESNDAVSKETGEFASNNSGGILGGISSGEMIEISIAVKPTPSIIQEQTTKNIHGKIVPITIEGRHDPCICPRIVPVAEAMVAITLADHLLRNRASKI